MLTPSETATMLRHLQDDCKCYPDLRAYYEWLNLCMDNSPRKEDDGDWAN